MTTIKGQDSAFIVNAPQLTSKGWAVVIGQIAVNFWMLITSIYYNWVADGQILNQLNLYRMQKLIKEYIKAQDTVAKLRSLLEQQVDGYKYLACTRCYGSLDYQLHNNEFTVQQLCDEYYGDNGIVDVYTTNPDSTISTYGDVILCSDDEFEALHKDNISMSQAIVNWIKP